MRIYIGTINNFFERTLLVWLIAALFLVSITSFFVFYFNGLGTAYNDARSHLDIARRVVEGLKPGIAQLGSVWLPLPHVLMIPTIWNNFMWHSGLAGAIPSMLSFITTGILIYLFLKQLRVGIFGRLLGVFIFAANINILFLQSTAMTELLLIATMTAGAYELLLWHKSQQLLNLIRSAFWIMLSTLVRYDGWFLFLSAVGLVTYHELVGKNKHIKFTTIIKNFNYQKLEGTIIIFSTLASFGIFLWFLWNLLIFKDPLYFAFGPYSAHTQQDQLEAAGELDTKGNLFLSSIFYLYALIYNSNAVISLLGFFGFVYLWFDKSLKKTVRVASLALLTPLMFNIIALFLGHSVLFIQGLSGNSWFNVRYGVMMMPSLAIFVAFLVDRLKSLRYALTGIIIFVTVFQFTSADAVTIDDATVGSSQKNVTEVSSWLNKNTKEKEGFILISAASHDAIIFSSRLPMSKYIHEGTGKYWESATTDPEHWARWIVMRTYDENDQTYRLVSKTPDLSKYSLVEKYPFADIYQLKEEYLSNLITKPIYGKQK